MRRVLPAVATGRDVVALYGPQAASHQALSAVCAAALRRLQARSFLVCRACAGRALRRPWLRALTRPRSASLEQIWYAESPLTV
jgi:hypothetical protein